MTKVHSEPKPFKCFISSANEDAKLANTIADAVRSKTNCEVFTDKDISHGTSWRQSLDEKVKDTDLFVVLISPAALSSNFVRDEWASIQERAWQSNDVAILPILVGETDAPAFLKPWKYIEAKDATPSDVSNAVTDCIQSFHTKNWTSKEQHSSFPSLKAQQTKRFRGLLKSLSADDTT
jgi:hypothetical protein